MIVMFSAFVFIFFVFFLFIHFVEIPLLFSQEEITLLMEFLNNHHDYFMVVSIVAFIFVAYFILFFILISYFDKYPMDFQVLEFIWTVVPMLITLLMLLNSLYFLYLGGDIYSPVVTLQVSGSQLYLSGEDSSNSSWLLGDNVLLIENAPGSGGDAPSSGGAGGSLTGEGAAGGGDTSSNAGVGSSLAGEGAASSGVHPPDSASQQQPGVSCTQSSSTLVSDEVTSNAIRDFIQACSGPRIGETSYKPVIFLNSEIPALYLDASSSDDDSTVAPSPVGNPPVVSEEISNVSDTSPKVSPIVENSPTPSSVLSRAVSPISNDWDSVRSVEDDDSSYTPHKNHHNTKHDT